MMKMTHAVLTTMLISFALLGCTHSVSQPDTKSLTDTSTQLESTQATTSVATDDNHTIKQSELAMTTLIGTLKYKSFEGGFFGFDSKDGQKFILRGLPKHMYGDGAIIKVTGTPNNDIMTIQQYGTVFDVVEAELIKVGSSIKEQDL